MLPKPAAVALDVDDLSVVKQPVEDSGADHGIPEEPLPARRRDLFPVKPIDLFQEFDGVFGVEERFLEIDSQELGGLFTVFKQGADHLCHQSRLAPAPHSLEEKGLFLVQLADAAHKQVRAGNPGCNWCQSLSCE